MGWVAGMMFLIITDRGLSEGHGRDEGWSKKFVKNRLGGVNGKPQRIASTNAYVKKGGSVHHETR